MKFVTLEFESANGGGTFDFLGDACKLQKLQPSYPGRVVERPRMQEHGSHPVVPLRGPLHITMEGLLVGTTEDEALVARDALETALLSGVDARPSVRRDGTLRVQSVIWGEPASAFVAVESLECVIDKENTAHAPFQIQLVAFRPFLEADSGSPYFL